MAVSSIIEYLNRDKRTVDHLVNLRFEEVVATVAEVEALLPGIMPQTSYADRMLLLLKIKAFPTIGYVVAPDGEIPIDAPRTILTEELLGNLKLAKSRGYLEKDFEAMRKLQMYFSSTGAGAAAAAQALSDYFITQPAELVEGIQLLAMLLTFQVIVFGKCLYSDPMTGAIAELDYTAQVPLADTARGATLPNLAPPITSATLIWSAAATAQGISDIVEHVNSWYINSQLSRLPRGMAIHRFDFINLINQRSSKQAVASLRGITLSGADTALIDATLPPTIEEMQTIIARRLVQQGGSTADFEITVFDKKVYSRGATGITNTIELLPPGYYFFYNDNLVERAFVPTCEKNFEAGIFTLNEEISKAPKKERSVAIACFVPLLIDPRIIGSRNVMNTAAAVNAIPAT